MAFFADSKKAPCQANDTSQGLVLTTSTIPSSFTCFNLTDIFSQTNDTGFRNATQRFYNVPQPNGIDWLLRNRDAYDANSNYSHVWYEQVNIAEKAGEGKEALLVFGIYAFPNCRQTGGAGFDPEQYPWFETSCQTKYGGQCRTVPYPIRSFGIWSSKQYDLNHGGCETWARMGAAAGLGHGALGWAAASACITVLALIM